MPRAYVYPTPGGDDQIASHPLERNTPFYVELSYCYNVLHQPYETWLKTTSEYERKLALKWYHLHLLKESYANTMPDKRGQFPS